MTFDKLQRPEGTKDYLPQMAAKKRELENKLNQLFMRWGYQEIITPTFEFYDLLSAGTEGLQAKMYKFFNRKGEILALRPEMTAPIARIAATELRGRSLPLRLCYQSNVFRYETPRAGRKREFYQAGIELLGIETPLGDAEVIAVAAESLLASGLNNFKIDIGDVDYFGGIMKAAKMDQRSQAEVRQALSNKNFVKLEELLADSELNSQQQEAILTAQNLRGGLEVIDEAKQLVNNQESLEALINLEEVYHDLELLGVSEYICLDLSVVRSFDYYTGIVFEGYTKDLGYTICGGGRYDKLVEKFDYPIPATGFALGIDRLLLSLDNQGYQFEGSSVDTLLLSSREQKANGFNLAKKLRQAGESVELEIYDRKLEKTIDYAVEKNINRLLIVGVEEESIAKSSTIKEVSGLEVREIKLKEVAENE
ncbi:ATP phosphoribosyltransferase regulatory subunit [Natroniella sulfidigena]|uniref:ATP phosphoribosyltransferase regulatory subunit n=1 Tax=Natroniella sulfidigena TaxID=723921 RepID=UPI00200ADF88|nr:ATP phosphoribosyltransferase regulatory subunit [Natroniella sulfidigena]MCK8817706.1 ATP phosphoribosyltransferase regulatory subunit [Natroniella sulfidigena]